MRKSSYVAGAYVVVASLFLIATERRPDNAVPTAKVEETLIAGINITTLTPRDIILRVASPAQLQTKYGLTYNRYAGITDWETSPCVVYIPEGWKIASKDAKGIAVWMDEDNSNTLAHEILHCYRKAWHPDWDSIIAPKVTSKEKP